MIIAAECLEIHVAIKCTKNVVTMNSNTIHGPQLKLGNSAVTQSLSSAGEKV